MFQFFFVLFLALYSYFVLTSLRPLSQPNTPPVVEIILSVWVLSMIFEEMRQVTIMSYDISVFIIQSRGFQTGGHNPQLGFLSISEVYLVILCHEHCRVH